MKNGLFFFSFIEFVLISLFPLSISAKEISNELSVSGKGMSKVVLNNNKPISQQINKANTIYVVKYDIDLQDDFGNNPIVIPQNSIIQFDGGRLRNGIIVGNNTSLESAIYEIFGHNLVLTGTWNLAEAYPEWFGAKGDGISDDTEAIERCLKSFAKVCLLSKYRITEPLNINYRASIVGKTGDEMILYDGNLKTPVFELTSGAFLLKDFIIFISDYEYKGHCIFIHKEEQKTSSNSPTNRSIIQGVTLHKLHTLNDCLSKGIEIAAYNKRGQYNISVSDCNIQGFAIAVHLNAENGYINSNTFERCYFHGAKTALKISNSGLNSMVCDNKFLSCSFQNAHTALYDKKYKAIDIDNDVFNIYENVIDIFLWDIAPLSGEYGSQHGSIGKLNHSVHNSFVVYCEDESKGVLIASMDAGSDVLGWSLSKIEIQSDELTSVFNISSNKRNVWVNEAYSYPKKDVPLKWGGYHKLYYLKRDNTIYFYLVGQSGFHQVNLPEVGILPIHFGGGSQPVSELELLSTPKRVSGLLRND